MSANKENNLVQAYIELNKFCQSGDYDRALKATGKSKFTLLNNYFFPNLTNIAHKYDGQGPTFHPAPADYRSCMFK